MDPITIGIIALAGWALCKKKTGNQDDEKQHEEPVQDYKVYSNKDAQLKTKSYEYFSEIVHEDTPPEQIGIALNRDKFYYKGGRKIFRSSNDIEYIVEYHPYYMHGERNPNFDYASSKILDVKKNENKAIYWYAERIKEATSKGDVICVVPSSNGNVSNYGIGKIAWILSKHGRINASKCLLRIRPIEKLANGGNRAITVHLESIVVQDKHLIKDNSVLLIDDVTTTGNSMMACKKLLLDAGAKDVRCLALAKTVSDY